MIKQKRDIVETLSWRKWSRRNEKKSSNRIRQRLVATSKNILVVVKSNWYRAAEIKISKVGQTSQDHRYARYIAVSSLDVGVLYGYPRVDQVFPSRDRDNRLQTSWWRRFCKSFLAWISFEIATDNVVISCCRILWIYREIIVMARCKPS